MQGLLLVWIKNYPTLDLSDSHPLSVNLAWVSGVPSHWRVNKEKKQKIHTSSATRIREKSSDWTAWSKKTQAIILCQSYTLSLDVPFFSCQKPHLASALVIPRARAGSFVVTAEQRWRPWPSHRRCYDIIQRRNSTRQRNTAACSFQSKMLSGCTRLWSKPLRCNCANLSSANANKSPRRPPMKHSDVTRLTKQPEIITKISLSREHEPVLQPHAASTTPTLRRKTNSSVKNCWVQTERTLTK